MAMSGRKTTYSYEIIDVIANGGAVHDFYQPADSLQIFRLIEIDAASRRQLSDAEFFHLRLANELIRLMNTFACRSNSIMYFIGRVCSTTPD